MKISITFLFCLIFFSCQNEIKEKSERKIKQKENILSDFNESLDKHYSIDKSIDKLLDSVEFSIGDTNLTKYVFDLKRQSFLYIDKLYETSKEMTQIVLDVSNSCADTFFVGNLPQFNNTNPGKLIELGYLRPIIHNSTLLDQIYRRNSYFAIFQDGSLVKKSKINLTAETELLFSNNMAFGEFQVAIFALQYKSKQQLETSIKDFIVSYNEHPTKILIENTDNLDRIKKRLR